MAFLFDPFASRNSESLRTIQSLNSNSDSSSTESSRKNRVVNDFIQMISNSNSTEGTTVNNSYTTSSIVFQPSVDSRQSSFFKENNNVFGSLSEIEANILRSSGAPIEIDELDEIVVNGERGILINKNEIINWGAGDIPLSEYLINDDPNPEKIFKKITKQLEYVQVLAFKYLRPPTPPTPGPIIIKQEASKISPPAPPVIIRQLPPRQASPEPLIIRERPPTPLKPIGRKLIHIHGKKLPPPPRKLVIERLAQLPTKPQSAIIERWLPYNNNRKRRVIFQRAPPDPIVIKPKNVIIQWKTPSVVIKKEFKYLGTIRADPIEYVKRYGDSLKQSHELPEYVKRIKVPEGIVLASDYEYKTVHELEGDVAALKLIDLEKEGIIEYRDQLDRLSTNRAKISYEKPRLKKFMVSNSLEPKSVVNNIYSRPSYSIDTVTYKNNTNKSISTDLAQFKTLDISISESEHTSKDFEIENVSSLKTSIRTSQKTESYSLDTKTEVSSQDESIDKSDSKSTCHSPSTPFRPSSDLCSSNSNETGPSRNQIKATLLALSKKIIKQQQKNKNLETNSSTDESRKSESTNVVTSSDELTLSSSNSSTMLLNVTNAAIDKLFSELDRDNSGRISVDEAQKNFFRFNARLDLINKSYSENELFDAIHSLNRYRENLDETVSLVQFRDDFKRLFF